MKLRIINSEVKLRDWEYVMNLFCVNRALYISMRIGDLLIWYLVISVDNLTMSYCTTRRRITKLYRKAIIDLRKV